MASEGDQSVQAKAVGFTNVFKNNKHHLGLPPACST
jgi:hypothetical protein